MNSKILACFAFVDKQFVLSNNEEFKAFIDTRSDKITEIHSRTDFNKCIIKEFLKLCWGLSNLRRINTMGRARLNIRNKFL